MTHPHESRNSWWKDGEICVRDSRFVFMAAPCWEVGVGLKVTAIM